MPDADIIELRRHLSQARVWPPEIIALRRKLARMRPSELVEFAVEHDVETDMTVHTWPDVTELRRCIEDHFIISGRDCA